LQFDRGEPVSQFGLIACESFLIDGIVDPQIDQLILLSA